MVDEKKNSIIVFMAIVLILLYVVDGILSLTETKLKIEQPKENAILFYNNLDDEDNEEENPEEETEEEPVIQCPPRYGGITPYELFAFRNGILMKPFYWLDDLKFFNKKRS